MERAAETLARVFDDVVIVSSRPTATDRWPRVPDEREGFGPLAGIEAALLAASRRGCDGAFVLACDMPVVDERTVRAVVDALGDSRAAAPAPVHEALGGPSAESSVGLRAEPSVEPLCAAYLVACLPELTRALDERRLAAHELFRAVGGATVLLPARSFMNVNTPEDHARAGEVLRNVLREDARGEGL